MRKTRYENFLKKSKEIEDIFKKLRKIDCRLKLWCLKRSKKMIENVERSLEESKKKYISENEKIYEKFENIKCNFKEIRKKIESNP